MGCLSPTAAASTYGFPRVGARDADITETSLPYNDGSCASAGGFCSVFSITRCVRPP